MPEVEPIPKVFKPKKATRPMPKRGRARARAAVDLAESIPVVQARSRGYCEARTDECKGWATQYHHRAGREFDGCHDARYLLHVCGTGTFDGCHGVAHNRGDWSKRHGLYRNGDVEIIDYFAGCPLSCEEDHR